MAKELRKSLEALRVVADITRALSFQMSELLDLREAVQKAEEAARKEELPQRQRQIVPIVDRAQAGAPGIETFAKHRRATHRGNQVFSRSAPRDSDVISLDRLQEARIRSGTTKTRALPGRLFMRSQWR